MTNRLPMSLAIKSFLVATPVEPLANQLRWWLGYRQRVRHPELWEIYLEEERINKILEKLLKRDSVAVDVGAHIGSFISKLRRYAPDGKHMAFEPSQTKSRWLESKFPDVRVFAMAVGENSGKAVFNEDLAKPGYSRLAGPENEETDDPKYEVTVCCLDSTIGDLDRLDLLKLDIEGGELGALKGATDLIGKLRPAIIFECGSEYSFADSGESRRKLFDFVTKELDYRIYSFSDYLFDLKPLGYDGFLRCGIYPFRAFNFVALSNTSHQKSN